MNKYYLKIINHVYPNGYTVDQKRQFEQELSLIIYPNSISPQSRYESFRNWKYKINARITLEQAQQITNIFNIQITTLISCK
jgi:hypothetical protein